MDPKGGPHGQEINKTPEHPSLLQGVCGREFSLTRGGVGAGGGQKQCQIEWPQQKPNARGARNDGMNRAGGSQQCITE